MPSEKVALRELQRRSLRDTGVFAREVLGYNYDLDDGGRKINEGKGGIYPYGRHQQCVELLDDRDLQYKLVLLPRESRKSTLAQALICRRIQVNRNIRIFYAARTQRMLEEKLLAIRNQLENPRLVAIFGDQRGSLWEAHRFTVSGRTNRGLMNPTVQGFTFDSLPHGGRAELVILDDFVDETNVATAEQLEKARRKWQNVQPLVAKGGELIFFNTVWDDDDLSADLEASPLFAEPHGGKIVCGAGVELCAADDGGIDLREAPGGIEFPHLTVEYLRKKLHGMIGKGGSPMQFCRQYLNQRSNSDLTSFHREDFREVPWGQEMERLTGYLLTDTATSEKKAGCFSVIAYVGIDEQDHIYLLDLRIGRWKQDEFVQHLFDTLDHWQHRVNHAGEVWERVQLAQVYMDTVVTQSRARKIRTNPILVSRTARSGSKPDRILRLQPVMRNRRFWICDTVPRTFDEVDGRKDLWNPTGYLDARTGSTMGSGELVDEFLRPSAKKDIPDTIAMILEYDMSNSRMPRRYCTHKTWRPRNRASLTDERLARYHSVEYADEQSTRDWWSRTASELDGSGF